MLFKTRLADAVMELVFLHKQAESGMFAKCWAHKYHSVQPRCPTHLVAGNAIAA